MKTLKEILQLEVYEPKSPDEKRFKDKHVVVKHKDANGNDDDLFNAKNIKTVDREPRHGYNPGEDEKVYESNAEYDESGRGKYKVNYIHPNKKNIGNDRFETKEQARRFANSLKRKGYHKVTIGEEKVYEEVEALDERQMNVYAIATAQVKKKHGLTGKNVDLTKAQTVEAHQLAKKIAKKMGVSLKESLDEQSLMAIKKAFRSIMGKKGPGMAAKRKELKAAAQKAAQKAATTTPPEQSTNDRMLDFLVKTGAIPNKKTPIPSPKYPEKMTGPEEAGPDGRYGTGPQIGGVYRDPQTGETFTGKWPGGVEPKSPRKQRSKK